MDIRKRHCAIAGAAALVLALAGARYAYAATASSDPPLCATHGHGTGATGNYILNNWDRVACPGGTYGLTITGAQGLTGPAGPSTAGASGLDVIEVTGLASGSGATTAVCPSTHPYVIGGGGSANGSKPNWIGIAVSEPVTVNGASAPNAWTVQGVPDGAESFTTYAMCAKLLRDVLPPEWLGHDRPSLRLALDHLGRFRMQPSRYA